MYRVTLAIAATAAVACGTAASAGADEAGRLTEAAKVVQEIRADIPSEYWGKARCVAVVPDLKKAAFIFGGEYGKGVMSCQSGGSWSAPLFMQIAKGSWGFQAGAEQVDLVLLVTNESGVEKLLRNKVTLGADASVAAGPIGRRGGVGTDAALTAEILTYSRSKGLFAGIDLSGGVLRPDEEANREIYGRNATPRTILASREISAPPEAAAFLRALGSLTPATSAPGAASAAAAPLPAATDDRRPGPSRVKDDDVRAQLIDMEQTIDRLLADTTPSAVGTSGSTAASGIPADPRASGTVTIERVHLLQLRRQIESLIASLNRQ